MTAREGNMGNCHPEKAIVDRGGPRLTMVSRGEISHVTLSCSQ